MERAGDKSFFDLAGLYFRLVLILLVVGPVLGSVTGNIVGGRFSDGSDGLNGELALAGLIGLGLGGFISLGIISLYWLPSRRLHSFDFLPAAVLSMVGGIIGIIVAAVYVNQDPQVSAHTQIISVLRMGLLLSAVAALIVSEATRHIKLR